MNKTKKPTNLVNLFEETVQKYPDNLFIGEKDENKIYQWNTYKEVGQRIDNLRGGLAQSGISKDDAVGFIGNNRTEWVLCAFATYGLKGRFIPMYETELFDVWKYIVEDSSIKILFVSSEDIYDKVKGFVDEIDTLQDIYIIESDGEKSLAALEKTGEENPVDSIKPDPDDVALLVYTSGTTGAPKGVLLTHKNLTTNTQAGWYRFPDNGPTDRGLSILPWAHAYALTAELHNCIQFGGSVGIAESIKTIGEDLAAVRPTALACVPRVFNKIYDGLWAKMNEDGGLAKALFVMGVEAGKKRRAGNAGLLTNIKFKIADSIVFKKIRDRFGGKLRVSLTGSATMNPEVSGFFFDIGIPVYDCYGLSETSPAITMNCPAYYKPGSVGTALKDIKIIIDKSVVEEGAKDGEIIAYGPNIMKGYHNKPKETAEVMTEDGGFRTGDRGRLDEDGFLWITGRIKEQYKLSNGKYVFPNAIEEDIKLIPDVANAMVYGEGKVYNICLIIPDFEVISKYAKSKGMSDNPDDIVSNEEITNMITEKINKDLSKKYAKYEIPKKYVFIAEDFTLENGMLTQTLKLKRKQVIKEYQNEINELYD